MSDIKYIEDLVEDVVLKHKLNPEDILRPNTFIYSKVKSIFFMRAMDSDLKAVLIDTDDDQSMKFRKIILDNGGIDQIFSAENDTIVESGTLIYNQKVILVCNNFLIPKSVKEIDYKSFKYSKIKKFSPRVYSLKYDFEIEKARSLFPEKEFQIWF